MPAATDIPPLALSIMHKVREFSAGPHSVKAPCRPIQSTQGQRHWGFEDKDGLQEIRWVSLEPEDSSGVDGEQPHIPIIGSGNG